jgi:hypothetical protein
MMHTSFFLSRQKFLEDKWKLSDLLSYFSDKSETVKAKGPYISLKVTFPIPLNILISKNLKWFDKVDFIEFATLDTNLKIELTSLKLSWGDFEIIDERERDNVVTLVFTKLKSAVLKSIELITREKVEENSDEVSVEAVRYYFK